MPSITIPRRFCGPPNSGNGGYVCGLLAGHIEGSAEITLRAPPPLERPLDIVAGSDGRMDLRDGETLLASARPIAFDIPEIPAARYAEAEEAARRTPYDVTNHNLPGCFVCGPARAHGDGLRIFAGPLMEPSRTSPTTSADHGVGAFAAPWIPGDDLASKDDRVAPEFVWAALDCPTAYAGLGARWLGLTGAEVILLGRMSGRVDARPKPGDRCVVVAWPTGRDGRKIFANSTLLHADGKVLAVAQATWLMVDRQVQLGKN